MVLRWLPGYAKVKILGQLYGVSRLFACKDLTTDPDFIRSYELHWLAR
jgi:hypothetical protein